MTWRDQLQIASIDGAEFDYLAFEANVGRRIAVTDYPFRDDPETQDVGRGRRTGRIDGILSGDSLFDDWKKIEAVIEKGGEHTLVHPYRGKLKIKITEPVVPRYTTDEGGLLRFTIVYLQVKIEGKVGKSDTLGPLQNAAAGARLALSSGLDSGLDLEGPDFIRDAANTLLAGPQGAISAMRAAYGKVSATIGVLDEIAYAIESFENELNDLLGLPGELASKLQGVMSRVMSLVTSPSSKVTTIPGVSSTSLASTVALEQLDTVIAFGGEEVPTTTPSRRKQAANQTAIETTVRGSAAIETTVTLAEAPASSGVLTSRERAAEVGAALVEALDTVAEAAPDFGAYRALKLLSAATHDHFTAVSETLPVTTTYTPPGDVPALVLAHYLYGDATRSDEIEERNDIKHPGFVPGGQPIEVAIA